MKNAESIFKNLTYCQDAYATADGADALVIATEWNEFRALNLGKIKAAMRSANVIDLRNVYDRVRMRNEGFTYVSVGRADDMRRRARR